MKKTFFISLLLSLLCLTAAAQTPSSVSGVVTDASGSPLVGVFVVVQGTQNGVSTGLDGDYVISCKPNDVLVFSCMGFTTVNQKVGSSATINVKLEDDTTLLDEVVVIGYGTTTRRSVVGSVDNVRSDVFDERPVRTATEALQGASPALVIQQSSFSPTSTPSMKIRGINSTNSSSPLYVIDGVISDATTFNRLNPSDIDQVSILKDAGTAAIYGSRSASGVVLVTTKNGKINTAPKVNLSIGLGAQTPELLTRPVAGYQNALLTNLAYENAGNSGKFTQAQIRDLYEHRSEDSFWFDEITNPALQQNYNVSVSGGGANNTYRISAGYYRQNNNYGNDPKLGVERYNFRANNVITYGNLKVSTQLAYARYNAMSPNGPNVANMIRIPTYYYYKLQDPETGHYLVNDIIGDFTALGELAGGYSQNMNNNVNLNVSADYTITKGLKLRGVFGMNLNANTSYTRKLAVDYYSYLDPSGPVKYTNNSTRPTSNSTSQYWTMNYQLMLDFDRYFGDHHVYALIGASNESYTSYGHATQYTYTDPDLGIPGDGTVITTSGNSVFPQNTTKTSLSSLFGRAGYDYANKYYAEFTFRYDGSSRFEKANRWGFFPSVTLGWRMSEEDWMGDYKTNVGDLKFRASYGELGNQAVSDYQYLTTWSNVTNAYGFNNEAVAGASFSLGGDNLTWETVKTTNLGFDASFLHNSLSVSFDIFNKNTTGILVSANAPSLYGASLGQTNGGGMVSYGFELNVNYKFKTGDVQHSINANVGDARNKLLAYPSYGITKTEELWRGKFYGQPYNTYYGYKTVGIFQSYEEINAWGLNHPNTSYSYQPGDLIYADTNGDNKVDTDDIVYLGDYNAHFNYGINYSLQWKGLDFSVLLQGYGQRNNFLRGELIEPFHESYSYNIFNHMLDYWTPTNTDARWPRLAYGNNYNYLKGYGSNMQILNVAYMRVKNLTIGYTLPQSISKKIGMDKLRIYANAQNPFTFSNNDFIDPESGTGGADSGRNYPRIVYYGGGLDITF